MNIKELLEQLSIQANKPLSSQEERMKGVALCYNILAYLANSEKDESIDVPFEFLNRELRCMALFSLVTVLLSTIQVHNEN